MWVMVMNDEIKEILEEMKSIIDTGKDINGIKVDGCGFHGRDLKLLYDCIINLKEENEDYKSRVEKAVEYLKNLKNYRFEFTFDSVDRHEIVGCEKNFVKDLLNILQNGSENK